MRREIILLPALIGMCLEFMSSGRGFQVLIAVLILSFKSMAMYGRGGDGIGECLITEKSMYDIWI